MYRPTVRYDDTFKDYINHLFHATHLDRNQLIRAALFAAAHSKEFRELLKPYQKRDVSLPLPQWSLNDSRYWMEQSPGIKGEGGDVNAINDRKREVNQDSRIAEGRGTDPQIRCIEPAEGRPGAIPPERIRITGGGITFKVN